ncbi:MAG TPA: O-antigen ligase family protein [Solirubrobacterales bacterium]|nr:O-antigen ligase family protein [Solirubrobacterales bacterium]
MAAEPASGPDPGSEGPDPAETRWSGVAAILALGLLGGILTWWTLQDGAYFGVVMYPGVALLCAGLIILVVTAPWRASLALSGPARLALLSLLGLAVWSLLSAFWSPTPDIAVEDAQRIVGYALFFGLGIWGCTLLGRRMELAVLPVVGAAGIVAVITLVELAGASVPVPFLEEDGTLQHPLAYRNANAAFFLIALWPALALAGSSRVHGAVRVGSLVTATACVELAILSQSRGSLPALIVALVVYLVTAKDRLNALMWFVLAVLPASLSILDASAMFDAAKGAGGVEKAVSEMNAAGTSGLLMLAVAAVIAFVAMKLEPRVRVSPRQAGLVLAAIAVVATVGVIAKVGNPVSWTADRAEEFCAGEADLSDETNRLTFRTGSNRCAIWSVALDVAADDPLFGEGGGGFQFRYNRERDQVSQLARDAHSVELEMLSELGIVGLALFAAAIIGAYTGAIRARRLGPSSAQLSCGALAGATYWLVHASADWFWPYPAVTAPAFLLLGAAVAPALLMPDREVQRGPRRLIVVGAAVVALSVIPPFLSERLVERSLDTFRVNTEQAYDDLALARDLNPLSDLPALTEGSIALALDDDKRAIAAFREAIRERPEEYVGHFFLALILAKKDPEQARTELAVVAELNPLEQRIEELERRIEASERRLERRR